MLKFKAFVMFFGNSLASMIGDVHEFNSGMEWNLNLSKSRFLEPLDISNTLKLYLFVPFLYSLTTMPNRKNVDDKGYLLLSLVDRGDVGGSSSSRTWSCKPQGRYFDKLS